MWSPVMAVQRLPRNRLNVAIAAQSDSSPRGNQVDVNEHLLLGPLLRSREKEEAKSEEGNDG